MLDIGNDFDGNIDIILNKYSNMVYRLAFSIMKNAYDAEDITQDVFIKYIKSDIEFENHKHLKAWLLKVTINSSRSLLRSAWFRRTTNLQDNIIIELEEKSEVYKYVLKLPKKYRTVIHLFYYEDMTTGDISTLLNIKESTVRSQLHRGRNILRESLEGMEFEL